MKKHAKFLAFMVLMGFCNANVPQETEHKIYQECMALKNASRNAIQELVAILGFLLVTKEKCPTLYKLVEECATKLKTPIPPLVLIFQGNLLTRILEEFAILDFRCNAATRSLSPSLSMFQIGEDFITDMINKNGMKADQLKAVIAHELGHVKRNHFLKILIIAAAANIGVKIISQYMKKEAKVKEIPYASQYLGGLVQLNTVLILSGAAFCIASLVFVQMFLIRQFEKEADAEAASILDNPSDLADALDRILVIAKTKPRFIEWVNNFFEGHPRNCDRRAALEAFKQSKVNVASIA